MLAPIKSKGTRRRRPYRTYYTYASVHGKKINKVVFIWPNVDVLTLKSNRLNGGICQNIFSKMTTGVESPATCTGLTKWTPFFMTYYTAELDYIKILYIYTYTNTRISILCGYISFWIIARQFCDPSRGNVDFIDLIRTVKINNDTETFQFFLTDNFNHVCYVS